MAKASRRRVALLLLLLPLLYAALLRCNFSLLPIGTVQQKLWHWSSTSTKEGKVTAGLYFRRLVRGNARWELQQNGITCVSDPESDICITSGPVKIVGTTVYLTAGQRLPSSVDTFTVRPYPRKTDSKAMSRTTPITLVAANTSLNYCDVTHALPAIIFSTGGFAGNFFHDINDVIIPLFLTSAHLRRRVRLLASDFHPWWARKYRLILSRLSTSDLLVLESGDEKVHCFPAVAVGLKYHDNLACNSTDAPGGISVLDFRLFLRHSLSLPVLQQHSLKPSILVLISRRGGSRVLLNEHEVVRAAEGVGFEVVVVTGQEEGGIGEIAAVVGRCGVLMGVHGAGITNMVFMATGAVLVQVVPWGLDWAAGEYYGRPAVRMGLRYVEYHVAVEESTLYGKYPRDHPVLADPWSINRKGYNVSGPVYTDGQNLTLHLSRFRETLLRARRLLPTMGPSVS